MDCSTQLVVRDGFVWLREWQKKEREDLVQNYILWKLEAYTFFYHWGGFLLEEYFVFISCLYCCQKLNYMTSSPQHRMLQRKKFIKQRSTKDSHLLFTTSQSSLTIESCIKNMKMCMKIENWKCPFRAQVLYPSQVSPHTPLISYLTNYPDN